MLDSDESGMVEFPEFVRVMAKRAEVEAIKKKTEEFREALQVKFIANLRFNVIMLHCCICRYLITMEMGKSVLLSLVIS